MNEGSPPAREPGKRRGPDKIVLLIAGIIASYVLVNGVMFWVSLQAPADLVRADYYAESKRVDEAQAAQAASGRTGWRVTLPPAQARPDAVTFQVLDAGGAPVAGLSGSVQAYRPSEAALDQPLALAEPAGAPGTYVARFARPAPGLWELRLELTGRGQRFLDRVRVVTPR
jgi:nitrogen fixation protein FixH